jgi:hypothetical protein
LIAVTTFSKKGYELYGRSLLDSFANWPGEVVIYYDEHPKDYASLEHLGFTWKNLKDVFGHDQFISYCDRNPIFRGKIQGGYSYTFDAVRFCHKAFAQFDVLQNYSGKVFWIDGDSEFIKPVTEDFMNSLFENHTLSILSRPGFYTETGFIGFDTEGEKFKEFLDSYISLYRKGLIFTLEGWHDCYAIDAAINQSQVPYKDLVGGWKLGDNLEVLDKTVLGNYLVHNKGGKKFARNVSSGNARLPVSLEQSKGMLS